MHVHSEWTLGLVGSATGGLPEIRTALVEPAVRRGWRVAATFTPTAGTWLEASGELRRIQDVTGLPARVAPRMPTDPKPHPPIDCYLICPASANTVAKLAIGLADNQALTVACEGVGWPGVPVVVYPRVNTAHLHHPAWESHLATLRAAGVQLLLDEEFGPVPEPRGRGEAAVAEPVLPWERILDAVDKVAAGD